MHMVMKASAVNNPLLEWLSKDSCVQCFFQWECVGMPFPHLFFPDSVY